MQATFPSTANGAHSERASEVLDALIDLGTLIQRRTDDPFRDLDAYFRALEEVEPSDLKQAVRRVLQGEQGKFLPSPPELRTMCDRAKAARLAELRKRHLFEQQALDQEAYGPVQRTEEEKQRADERMKKFRQSNDAAKSEESKYWSGSANRRDNGGARHGHGSEVHRRGSCIE